MTRYPPNRRGIYVDMRLRYSVLYSLPAIIERFLMKGLNVQNFRFWSKEILKLKSFYKGFGSFFGYVITQTSFSSIDIDVSGGITKAVVKYLHFHVNTLALPKIYIYQ